MSVEWHAVIDRGMASKYADPEEYVNWFVDRLKSDMRKAVKEPGRTRRLDEVLRVVIFVEEKNVTVA